MIAFLAAEFLLVVNAVLYAALGYPWYVVIGWIAAIALTWRLRDAWQ